MFSFFLGFALCLICSFVCTTSPSDFSKSSSAPLSLFLFLSILLHAVRKSFNGRHK